MSPEFPSSIVAKELYQFCGRGKVWSYTTINEKNHAPTEFEDYTPYYPAIIQLEEGPLVTAQLTDLDWRWETVVIDGEERQVKRIHVEIGMPVEMVTRLLKEVGPKGRGLLIYGSKFRPIVPRTQPLPASG